MDSAQVPIGGILRSAPLGEWRTLTVPLRCFAQAGLDARKVTVPASISTAGTLQLSISDVRVASAMVPQNVCGQN
jgi:beta-glucosidase